MKIIFNSFLRNIGKILSFIFIVIILYILCLLFDVKPKFLEDTYALNSGYASSSYDVAYVDCGSSTSNPQCGNTWGSWAGRQNIGVRIVDPYTNGNSYQTRYSFRLIGSSTYTYVEGNTYTWNIVFSTSYDQYNELKTYYRLDNLVGNTSTSSDGASSQYFKSYTYSIARDGTSTNRYVLKITFEPNANLRYLNAYFYINSTQNRYIASYGVFGNVTYNSTTITYEQGLSSAIANQNTILTNGFENVVQVTLSSTQSIIQGITSSTNETNDLIKDDSIDNQQANSYFENFDSDDFGLSDIVAIPLTYINNLSSGVCTPLNLPLPFVNHNVSLPCMTNVYQTHFPTFLTLWQLITNGLISYWVCVNIFASVKGFKDPQSDKVEVFDL